MHVSSNEYKILQLLWKEGRPLTRAEILKGTEGRNWNPASIHLILNSMISKGAIRITDEEKKYARTYEANYAMEDYVKDAMSELFPGVSEKDLLITFMDAYVRKNGKISKRALNDVQKFVDDRMAETKRKKKASRRD